MKIPTRFTDNPTTDKKLKICIYYQAIRDVLRSDDKRLTHRERFIFLVKRILIKTLFKMDRTLIKTEGDRIRAAIREEIKKLDGFIIELQEKVKFPIGDDDYYKTKEKERNKILDEITQLKGRKTALEASLKFGE